MKSENVRSWIQTKRFLGLVCILQAAFSTRKLPLAHCTAPDSGARLAEQGSLGDRLVKYLDARAAAPCAILASIEQSLAIQTRLVVGANEEVGLQPWYSITIT